MTVQIQKQFEISISEESTLIAESFGIEDTFINNVLNISLPSLLPLVTLITGESGCGKSTLLRELGKTPSECSLADESLPLHLWGLKYNKTENDTLHTLCSCGLSDASLFILRYNQLSDSQKYRAKIADCLLSEARELILDEFLATLDRDAACAIAFLVQKLVRKKNLPSIFVTSHTDLEPYLMPDLVIKGTAFPSHWTSYSTQYTTPFQDIRFEFADKEFYRQCTLGDLHYKGKYTGGVKEIVVAKYRDKPVGILLSVYQKINGEEGRRISRVVIHPNYRGIGIGSKIVQSYLCWTKDKYHTDAVAAMGRYNPFFSFAGMERLEDSECGGIPALHKELLACGFDESQQYKKSYCNAFLSDAKHRELLSKYAKQYSKLVNVGGKKLSDDEVAEKVKNNISIAVRVLWNLRHRKMAKYLKIKSPA